MMKPKGYDLSDLKKSRLTSTSHSSKILSGTACLLLTATLSVSVFAHAARLGRSARPFPDTKARSLVFADQLPTRLTPAQMKFVAAHYVGCQKMPRAWARQIRKLNPGFIILHYQLAVGAGPASFPHVDSWVNDFDTVSLHKDWFIRTADGQTLLQNDWSWYVMDVRFDGNRPRTGFPAYWLNAALQRMRDNEDDGVFADSYTQDILMGQVKPSFPWFQSAESCRANWLPHLNRYGAFCANGFHRQPERFYYLPNLGGLVTTWDRTTDYAVGDGGMNEGFCATGPGRYYSDDDWKLQMSRLLTLASKRKILLCQTSISSNNVDHRWFVLGSYLLTKGHASYLNMFDKSTFEWYPEYALDLGGYEAEPKPDVSAYWAPQWGVYRRNYQKGMVLVNPSARAVTVSNLGKEYRLVRMEGGGAINEEGKSTGRLWTDGVVGVTIPAHSARILLNAE